MKEQAAKKAADDMKVERATRSEAQHLPYLKMFTELTF